MKRCSNLLLALALLIVTAACVAPAEGNDGVPDDFQFSLVWNVHASSSFDSRTGKLVKTTDAANPEDYVTQLMLDDAQRQAAWEVISELNVADYPDEYDPHCGQQSKPNMTLILSVSYGGVEKTVTCNNIALSYQTGDAKGQAFLAACETLELLLTETEAWKALPEFEAFYR